MAGDTPDSARAAPLDSSPAQQVYDADPRTRLALEQRIEQLGVMRQEREAEWHGRAFPINHPKNYTAVPTPDAKQAMDELVRIYNTACEKGEIELLWLAGRARGMNPLMIYADAHPAAMLAGLGMTAVGVLYIVTQVGPISEYFGK